MTGKGAPVRNPFEYGRELDRAELVDRQAELHQIARTIDNGGKLFLIGPRRFGKTSLLHAAAQDAGNRGASVLRFDAEKYETLPLLSQALLTAAVRALKGPAERALEAIARGAARLRPQLTMDAQGNVSVGLDHSGDPPLPVLADTLDAIEQLARTSERRVVVILDEVQQIVVDHGLAAERQLRATVQQHRHTSYIFAGSAVRLLSSMTSDANRPFYRLGARLFLDIVPPAEFQAFLRDGFSSAGHTATDEALEAILQSADHVPYNVQRLAHELWEMLRSGELEDLTSASARTAVLRIVRREDPAYTQAWTQLTRNQKKTLKAVIVHGGERLQSMEVAAGAGLSAASIQTALEALEAAHIVRRADSRGRVRYCLVDPFLGDWLTSAQAY